MVDTIKKLFLLDLTSAVYVSLILEAISEKKMANDETMSLDLEQIGSKPIDQQLESHPVTPPGTAEEEYVTPKTWAVIAVGRHHLSKILLWKYLTIRRPDPLDAVRSCILAYTHSDRHGGGCCY